MGKKVTPKTKKSDAIGTQKNNSELAVIWEKAEPPSTLR
jgi:hypothetical protein